MNIYIENSKGRAWVNRAKDEYIKRLGRYATMLKDNPKGGTTISVRNGAKAIDSVELSRLIDDILKDGSSTIVFDINARSGVSQYEFELCNISFEQEILELMLLEQVYRAFRISYGEPYHK